jgi:hypothetical protein
MTDGTMVAGVGLIRLMHDAVMVGLRMFGTNHHSVSTAPRAAQRTRGGRRGIGIALRPSSEQRRDRNPLLCCSHCVQRRL